MWIDSHCHLNHARITGSGTPETLIADAKANNVDGLVTICCRMSEEADLLESIANAHDNVWCTIGTHPHDAGLQAEKAISCDDIVARVNANPNIIGIGETGLDYFYNNSPESDQKSSFNKHLQACTQADVPVIIHTRDADEDTANIIESHSRENQGNITGVLHCFSSGEELAYRALDLGFYISLSGILTFNKSVDLRDMVKKFPIDRLLVETDSPFLAPQSKRGKTNVPHYVDYVGKTLAEIHNKSAEDMAEITSRNFFNLFKKANKTNG